MDAINRMSGQAATERRFASIVECAREGRLPFTQLMPEDIVQIISSYQGVGYKGHIQRELRFEVVYAESQTLGGIVLADTYNRAQDSETRRLALAAGSLVTFLGAFRPHSTETEVWEGDRIDGQLHVGRHVEYVHPDYDSPRIGLLVQEIMLLNQDQTVTTNVFNTNPLVYRFPPPFIA